MKLMTGLVEVAVIVSVQLQTTQRQYDMENSKRADSRASDKLEELQATISEVTNTHKHTGIVQTQALSGQDIKVKSYCLYCSYVHISETLVILNTWSLSNLEKINA